MEKTVESLKDRHTEDKSWGWEEWIVNNHLYCGKRLHFDVLDGHTSMHFHVNKHETMFIERGAFKVEIINTKDASRTVHHLNFGDSIVIPPNTPHQITAVVVGSIMTEFSTHHENDDSYRVHL